MNEWCKRILTKEQKDYLLMEAIKEGYDPEVYFKSFEEAYFSGALAPSDGSQDMDNWPTIHFVAESYRGSGKEDIEGGWM